MQHAGPAQYGDPITASKTDQKADDSQERYCGPFHGRALLPQNITISRRWGRAKRINAFWSEARRTASLSPTTRLHDTLCTSCCVPNDGLESLDCTVDRQPIVVHNGSIFGCGVTVAIQPKPPTGNGKTAETFAILVHETAHFISSPSQAEGGVGRCVCRRVNED